MASMTITTTISKPRRRWLQFSVKGLLLIMVAVAVSLGSMVSTVREFRDLELRQSEAANALRKKGFYIQQSQTGSGVPFFLGPLRRLLGERAFPCMTRAVLSNYHFCLGITDADVPALSVLTQLESLNLNSTRISDAALIHVGGLRRLQSLSLYETQVTDVWLLQIARLTRLRELDLGCTQITDAGLVYIEGLTDLRDLDLAGTRVGDAALAHIKELEQLEIIRLYGTNVTDGGVHQLQRAFPNLAVIH